MSHFKTLQITNFRNYESAQLDGLSSRPVVIHGENGTGKTNILEAISFFVPGRGLRSAKLGDIQNKSMPGFPWAVSAGIDTAYGLTKIGTGKDQNTDKRLIRINGEKASAQTALAEYLSMIWLTPQMDRLFLEGTGQRRRFYDRLIFAFDPAHSGRISRYEKALSQRSKILKDHESPDPIWLSGLEKTLAETGVAIAAARIDFLGKLQDACDSAPHVTQDAFPKGIIQLRGTVEDLLHNTTALEVEDMFKYQLEQSRPADALTGGSATGPHKTDLHVKYAAKDMDAAQCSTGEQKALLIAIILAHSRLLESEHKAKPVLLFDEVAAHLDQDRRGLLYDQLQKTGCQFWLTGTDFNLFESLADGADFFYIDQGKIKRTPL